MPYPVPPPEPPPLIRTLPAPTYQTSQPGTPIAGDLTPNPTEPTETLVQQGKTISYHLSELKALQQDFPTPLSISAEELGSEISFYPQNSPSQILEVETPSARTKNSDFNSDLKFSSPLITLGSQQAQATDPPPSENSVPIPVILPEDLVEITADRQEYDQKRQIVTAQGNVILRFRQTLVDADQAQVNLSTRQVAAQGNVALTRGDQVIRGRRMEYNLVKNTGVIYEASGVIANATAGSDLAAEPLQEQGVGEVLNSPISDRITSAQPVENVTAGAGADVTAEGVEFPSVQGGLNRLRFEADQIDIAPDGEWEATNVRITNDPFSPPELELRADTARLRRVSRFQDELLTTGSRLVFDQSFSLPLFRDRTVIDRRQREPNPFSIGYDLDDLDGYYVEWNVDPLQFGTVNLDVSPQFLIQRAFEQDLDPFDGRFYGLRAELSGPLSTTTFFDTKLSITSFEDFPDLEEDEYRASLRVRQLIGGYTLTGEYSYRDRLFNGTLGFRTVHRSAGAVLTSPEIPVGKTGAVFRFQTAFQHVEADTDQIDLLEPNRDNNRISRSRFQGIASLVYPVILWQGEALPSTPTEGLKYTARPVVPFVRFVFQTRGVTNIYTEDDSQSYLSTTVGFQGQFGNFSRNLFDYTGFNIFYTQVVRDGESPFLFDRRVDESILTLGLVQQIYGSVRAGFETSINLETGESIDNQFTLEYSRRTYGVLLRINPVRRLGSLNLRISDFNWTGGSQPFSGEKE